MPTRKPNGSKRLQTSAAGPTSTYDALERRRDELHARLAALGATAKAHPGFDNAKALLNQRFRGSRLAERHTILDSAAWQIDVLELLTRAD